MTFFESPSRSNLLLERDLFRKPVSTFRDHALANIRRMTCTSIPHPPPPAQGRGRHPPPLGEGLDERAAFAPRAGRRNISGATGGGANDPRVAWRARSGAAHRGGRSAPAATPDAAVATLEKACARAAAADEYKAIAERLNATPKYLPGAEFRKLFDEDSANNADAIRRAGLAQR